MATTRKPIVKSHMGSRISRVSHSASKQELQKSFQAGLSDILENLGDFIQGVKDFVPEVGVEALEETLGKAIEYTPIKDGTLRDSAYLEAETQRGRTVIAIGFGRGGKPDYAIYVHELPYQHEEPTRSKFLEAALDEDYYSILNKIPRLIRERAGT